MTKTTTNRIANLIIVFGLAGFIYAIIGIIKVLTSPDYDPILTKLV